MYFFAENLLKKIMYFFVGNFNKKINDNLIEIMLKDLYNKSTINFKSVKGENCVAEKSSIFDKVREKNEQLSISVPKEVKEKILQKSGLHGISYSSYCRKIFDIYFENEEEILAIAEGRGKVVPLEK